MKKSATKNQREHFELEEFKTRLAQNLFATNPEAETIELSLEEIYAEMQRNRIALRAHKRLLNSGIHIKDVYGVLDE
jgi:hypothetical protein